MLKLKGINNIQNKRVCFCGEPLVGNFCIKHGIDVRVEMHIINASFQIASSSGEPWIPLQNISINVELPSNQFNRLFKLRPSTQTNSLSFMDFKVTLSEDVQDISLLLREFFDHLDLKSSFGGAFILQTFLLKRKSKVTIYFLVKYKVLSRNIIHFSFAAVPFQRLSDYVLWRKNQCRGDHETIIQSLLSIRSSVFQENGEAATIVKLDWEPKKKLPSKIKINLDSPDSQRIKLPSQLYYGSDHFFIGQNKAAEVQHGLENISFNFLHQFRYFLREYALDGRVDKLKDIKKYDHLVGTLIKPNQELLQHVGDWQKQQLRSGRLDGLIRDKFQGITRKLLVISCSATKDPEEKLLSAILRYSGEVFLLLKSVILDGLWPLNVDIIIVSAKYGLLNPLDYIPFYELALRDERIPELRALIHKQTRNLNLDGYIECFVNLSRRYLQSIEALIGALEKRNCAIIRIDKEDPRKRNDIMLSWLSQEIIAYNKDH